MTTPNPIHPASIPGGPAGPSAAAISAGSAIKRGTSPGSLDRQTLAATANVLHASKASVLLRVISNVSVQPQPIRFPTGTLQQIGYSLPLGSSVRVVQGQNFAVNVQFSLAGPATTMDLTYSGFPPGVTPSTTSVNLATNQTRRIVLNFSVARDIALENARPVIIRYTGYEGAATGEIPLTLTVGTGFDMQHQLESEWCWAATSTSVYHFYNPSSTITQCQVVNHQLNRTDACVNGDSPACNQPGYLDEALAFLGCLNRVDGIPEPFATVVSETSTGRPLGIRVAWAGGGAHFLASSGYEQNQLMVVEDPIYGTSVVPYSTMLSAYQGSGSWTTSYLTKP
jgi:hypothetical protein